MCWHSQESQGHSASAPEFCCVAVLFLSTKSVCSTLFSRTYTVRLQSFMLEPDGLDFLAYRLISPPPQPSTTKCFAATFVTVKHTLRGRVSDRLLQSNVPRRRQISMLGSGKRRFAPVPEGIY